MQAVILHPVTLWILTGFDYVWHCCFFPLKRSKCDWDEIWIFLVDAKYHAAQIERISLFRFATIASYWLTMVWYKPPAHWIFDSIDTCVQSRDNSVGYNTKNSSLACATVSAHCTSGLPRTDKNIDVCRLEVKISEFKSRVWWDLPFIWRGKHWHGRYQLFAC